MSMTKRTPILLTDNSCQPLLSIGKLVGEQEYTFRWDRQNGPTLTTIDGVKFFCDIEIQCPVINHSSFMKYDKT